MFKKIINKIKGFTILESLVSISILAVAVTGPLVYVTNSFQAAEVARDQTIAFFLAQDAVEHIKNIRDDNGLDPILTRSQWLDGLDSCIVDLGDPTTKCYFDHTSGGAVTSTPTPCSGNVCGPMNKSGTGSSFVGYSYDTGGSWTASPFTRTIEMEEVETGEEIQVTVTIEWQTKGRDRSVVVVEHIFNTYKTEEAF